MDLSSYAQALGAAQQLVPSYDQLKLNALRLQDGQQQLRINEQRIAENERQAAEQERFLADLRGLGNNPTPQAAWSLAARYPTMAGLSKAAEALGADQRREVTSFTAQVHSALQAGRPDLARGLIQRRVDAEKAAGAEPDPEMAGLLSMIDSGDAKQIEAAKGSVYAMIAAMNPETAAKNVGDSLERQQGFTLAPGSKRYDAAGNVIAEAPFAPQYRSVGEGETLVELGGAEGGDPASGTGGGVGGSGAPSGRTQFGWTPRARHGGDNSDAAVDNKIAGMTRFLGVSATTPFPPGTSNLQIAQALALSEGGPGSLADRNNNPGNIRDPKTGAYRKFPTKEAGLQAAAAQVARNRARGQNTIQTMVEGIPVGGSRGRSAAGGARVVATGAPKQGYSVLTPQEAQAEGLDPTVRYQRSPDGAITAIGGQNRADSRKAGTDLRKEFDGRAEVAEFRKARPAFNALRTLANKKNPSGADDIALIFAYNKALDPQSVVRESEFKQAANTSGAIEAAGQRFVRAKNGQWLNPATRQNLVKAAYASYAAKRDSYNSVARQYNGYAQELGVNPRAIGADIATPNYASAQPRRVRTLQEAQALPPGTIFIDPRGVRRRR
jgi:hypothetical protein